MSRVPEPSSSSTQVSPPTGIDRLPPVTPPHKSLPRLVSEVLDHGGPGYLQFAITNLCNAKCGFCGFAVDRFNPRQRRSVTLDEAREVIDICVPNHIGYLLFVGGEPMVHRDLGSMVRYAAERGVRPMICTNGSLFTDGFETNDATSWSAVAP